MKKKILILGSEGQIGNHLKIFLNKNDYKVLEFDLVKSKKEDLRIRNNKILDLRISKSDFVFFLAFDVGGSRYLKKYQNKFKFISNNIQLMENTFTILKKHKKPFVFASSQMSNMNYSAYGILKRLGEKYTEIIGGVVVKFWNVYGVEKDLDKSHVITDFILKAIRFKNISMLTNGKEQRDFLYADDCCAGLEKILINYKNIKKLNKSIDLTTGKFTKIKDIAKIIKKLLKKKRINVKIKSSKSIDTVQLDKKNIPNSYIKKYWKPKYSIENGISEILNYYLKNNNDKK